MIPLLSFAVLVGSMALMFAPFWFPGVLYLATRRTRSGDSYTQLVIDLLTIGKDWSVNQHYARHPCGVDIWVASGRNYLKYESGSRSDIPLLDRGRIWYAFTKMRKSSVDTDTSKLAAAIVAKYSGSQSHD